MDSFQAALPVPLLATHWQLLQAILLPITLPKGGQVLRPGQQCDRIYFIRHGLLRHYLLDEGREINTHFALPGTFTTDFASLAGSKPSMLYLEAMKPTVLWVLSRGDMLGLYERATELQAVGRGLMEQLLAQQQVRLELLLRGTAAERYHHVQQQQPELLQAVSLRQLASYLGVSRETLSRVRGAC
ncbi:Crp/Fnr family transcriptional regulator [Hymenobacter negativus]|uniref:Crp/Fnr family transcriptional regulator n=1 Tax=Hymenobacter negativus TaxID=2795026 RepID=A0ABS3QI82_9BACT|nr:Crp/Fnr family transcriptional regulator [Hymenobacter negativus]MBO2010946.1 Crp/Fnr family transcriptional regulator [Hymenobacter negativus]